MNRRFRIVNRTLPVLLLTVASTVLLAEDSWTTFRGGRGTGAATGSLPPGDGPLTLEVAWKRDLGKGYSGISIAGDRVVTAYGDGEHDLIAALDVDTGREAWRFELGPEHPPRDGSFGGPTATPAIADGRVFMLDPAGRFVALSLESGHEIWSANLAEDLGVEKPYYGFATSPAVAGDVVVLQIGGEGGSVAAFDVVTGEMRWRSFEDAVEASSPIVTEIGGRPQVLVLGETRLVGLDPADGTVLWEFEHGGQGGAMGAMTQSPIPLAGGRIFVKHENPSSLVVNLAEVDGALGAFELSKSKALTRSYSPVTVSGDRLYGFTSRFLSAVDPDSGELFWRTRDVGDGFLISIDDHLAIIEKTGSLHLGAASPEGWTEAARLDLFDDLVWTPPSYTDGSVYVRSLGEIARVDVKRAPALVASTAGAELPASLSALAATLDSASDPAAAVDAFLEGRSLPIVDGRSVTFVWRGEAEDVAVAGDMIGMRREEPMERLEGTDLWWWETEIDPHSRISYLFYRDLEPTLDPSHDRVTTATILGPDMNWKRDETLEMSWFAGPEWPGNAVSLPTATASGRMEAVELTVEPSAPEGEEIPEPMPVSAQVWLPPGYDDSDALYPVIYVVNSEAAEEGRWPESLDRVVGETVQPLIVVFVDRPRGPGLQDALAKQIVPQIDERLRTRADREGRAIVGMGFPGFSALREGLSGFETFGAIGVQSLFLVEGVGMKEALQEAAQAKPLDLPIRIYLEWGRWDLVSPHEDMNFRATGKWAWDFLNEAGLGPVGGEVWDSTDFASWSNRTHLLLEALFPMVGTSVDLTAWQTGSP